MKEILSKNVCDNELLDDNIDYIVNVINDKTLRNQIQIEIMAKNLKKKQKDVKLRIESELITTIIEENYKLNRVKRTTIRTKLMPKVNNAQSMETMAEKPQKPASKSKKERKSEKLVAENLLHEINVNKDVYERMTGSSDSGLSDLVSSNKNDLMKTKTKRSDDESQTNDKSGSMVPKKKLKTPKVLTKKLDNELQQQDNKIPHIIKSPPIRKANFVLDSVKRIEKMNVTSPEKKKSISIDKDKETVTDTKKTEQPSKMLKVLNHLLRNKYMKEFKLKSSELDVIFAFYNENKKGTQLDTSKLENFLYLTTLKRGEVTATRENIVNCLIALDTDKDRKLSLDEFIHLLVLFFADKSNLKNRIESVLQNMSIFHKKNGWLNPSEAFDFFEFINKFYGNFAKSEMNSDDVDYKSFCLKLAPILEPYLFVKW